MLRKLAVLPILFATVAFAQENLRLSNEARIYQSVKHAVVNISATRLITARVGSGDDFFDLFSGPVYRQVPTQSLGSGFIIHSAGYIVTNEHVIDRAAEVQVQLYDGSKLDAQVIATDESHDLAVLKVSPPKDRPLHAIALGSSEDLLIGEPVVAIGNPFGYGGTMTRGIVSAINRTIEAGPEKSLTKLIQTDTSINPGNSGGPLINAYGQVIGINTAIRAQAQGIGFAIGVSELRDLLPSFLNAEAIHRAQIGFTLEEKRTLTPPANVAAAVIAKLPAGSTPASKAGLATGDQILAIDGKDTPSVVDALVALANIKVGDTVSLRVAREGKRMEVKVPVTPAPPPEWEQILAGRLGIQAQTVTPALARKNKLAVSSGLLVTKVSDSGPAANSGIEAGDVLFQLGRYYVNTVEDAATLLKTAPPELKVRVGVVRGNQRGRTDVRLR